MLLGTSVKLFSGCGVSRASVLCKVVRKDPFLAKWNLAHTKSAQRPPYYTAKEIRSHLRVPFIFTIGTGAACLLGHQYLGKLISPRSHRPDSIFSWWHSKPDTFKVYWLICGTCVAICSAFRLSMVLKNPSFLTFMDRYFVSKYYTASRVESCAQLILASFSHISPIHLCVNMFVFKNIAETLIPEIGKERFLGSYIFCGVLASYTSIVWQGVRGVAIGSVGASGAILGLIGMVILRHPEYSFHIIFLPFIKIPGPAIFVSLATIDVLGMMRGWQFFDHAGHLGGLFGGLFWQLLNWYQEVPKETFQKPAGLPEETGFW